MTLLTIAACIIVYGAILIDVYHIGHRRGRAAQELVYRGERQQEHEAANFAGMFEVYGRMTVEEFCDAAKSLHRTKN